MVQESEKGKERNGLIFSFDDGTSRNMSSYGWTKLYSMA
jgi:hypothetical protein